MKHENGSSGASVLVIDDNWVACEIVREALESRQHKVVLATTGNAGMEKLTDGAVDLILLDLMLPDVDGAVLINRIRQLPGGGTIPILAFSAFISRLEELQRGHTSFDGFIAKPVEPLHLIEIVEKHLKPGGREGLPELHTI